jgi:acyl-CoA thioesterase
MSIRDIINAVTGAQVAQQFKSECGRNVDKGTRKTTRSERELKTRPQTQEARTRSKNKKQEQEARTRSKNKKQEQEEGPRAALLSYLKLELFE